MKPLLILGINGSPRKANTDILLEEALKGSKTAQHITTATIFLRKENINFCTGCFKCFKPKNDFGCQVQRDSMDEIFSKLKECHAILLASPVYFGQVTAQMKVFMDRTEPLLRYSQGKWKSLLKDKIGAALALGGNRHGGQETTIQAMHHFFLIHDMLVVGTGSADRPGCYLGAAATTYPNRGKIKDAVIKDKLGLYAARSLGIRVAETVQRISKNK